MPTPEPERTNRPHPTDPPAMPSADASQAPETGARRQARPGVASVAFALVVPQEVDPSAQPSPTVSARPGPIAVGLRPLIDVLLDALLVLFALALDAAEALPDAAIDPVQSPGATPRAQGALLPYLPPRLGSVGIVTHGIDLSLWNERVPFGALRDAGVRFAVIKATQGTTIVDPAYTDHVAAARRQRMHVGAYHFYDYRLGGRAQADHFVDTLVAAGTLRRSLPLVVDVECFAPFGAADRAWVRGSCGPSSAGYTSGPATCPWSTPRGTCGGR
ncbi:MAG: GH25 family lysozyme [Chloroflexota bacterium]